MLPANQIAGFSKMHYLKKEVNDKEYFWHADTHRSIISQDTQNRALVIFLQYIKKKVLQMLLCSIVMQNI